MIHGNALHLLIVANELIERGTEISVPFDFDYKSADFLVECACSNDNCPVKLHNTTIEPLVKK